MYGVEFVNEFRFLVVVLNFCVVFIGRIFNDSVWLSLVVWDGFVCVI